MKYSGQPKAVRLSGFWLQAKEIAAWLTGRRRRFVVRGRSMEPFVYDGQQVVVDTDAEPAVGDVVVVRHPFKRSQVLVKRVVRVVPATSDASGGVEIRGDNPGHSTDSRTLGVVSLENVAGVVLRVV